MPPLASPAPPTLGLTSAPATPPPPSAIPPAGFLVWDDGTGRLWCSGGRIACLYPDDPPVVRDVPVTALPWPPGKPGIAWAYVETDPDGAILSSGVSAAASLPANYRHRAAATDSPGDLGSDGMYILPLAILGPGHILPVFSGLSCLPVSIDPSGVSQSILIGTSILGITNGRASSWTP